MVIRIKNIIVTIFFASFICGSTLADVKSKVGEVGNGFLERSLFNMFNGPGTTEVSVKGIENKKPEIEILLVRPLSLTEENAFFSQIQLNNYYVQSNNRIALNLGFGYRQVFLNKSVMSGMNIFFDVDDEDNTRTSFGLELKSNSFKAYANYYKAISSTNTVSGDKKERVLDGYDIHILGKVPYFPWADVHYKYFEWQAEKNVKDTYGEELSLEMLIHSSLMVEVGYEDNRFDAPEDFVKVTLFYPGKGGPTAFDDFISETAFIQGDVSNELLSKVERTNRIMVETESAGVVIGRLD